MVLPRWPTTLRTRRLELRPYRTEDHASWITGMSTRGAPRYRYDGAPLPPRRAPRSWFRALCRRHRRLWMRDEVYVLGVFDRRTGDHLGHVDIGVIERRSTQRANLGYSIHNTHQGRGYGTEACIAAITFAFRSLGLHRLEAVIDPDNHPSLRLARRIGMIDEGVWRSFWFQDGEWADQVVFTAVHGSWRATEQAIGRAAVPR
jgi:ribosomal-protein-alanine N-acetyltransferase